MGINVMRLWCKLVVLSHIVDSYLCCCSHCVCGNCVGSLFCNVVLVLGAISRFAIFLNLSLTNRALIALLSSCCFVAVFILRLFLKVPWGGL